MPDEEIIAVECELAAYRKGSISVRLNLQQGYLTWRESRQWCNNFIRSLTDEQIRAFRDLLSDSGLLDRARLPSTEAETAPGPISAGKGATVQLTVFWTGRQLMLTGEDLDLTAWKSLCKAIKTEQGSLQALTRFCKLKGLVKNANLFAAKPFTCLVYSDKIA